MDNTSGKPREGGAASRLARLIAGWQAPFRSASTGSLGAVPELDPRLQACADKVSTALLALEQVRSGDQVFVGTACATPRTLVAALARLTPRRSDIELVHFLTDSVAEQEVQAAAGDGFRHRCYFVGKSMRDLVRRGMADYVPISIARVPHLMAIGRIPVDVALIQVSMPDEFGYVSLGVSVDIIPAAVARARLVIAEINPSMPRSMGDSMLHVSDIDRLVPVDTPVIEYQHVASQEQAVERIARYIGSIIEDGSTLQIGLGRFSNEALKYLDGCKDLGIHSDVITDAIIPLLEKGILTGRRKSSHVGKVVTSFAMGSRRLYDLIDRNPMFSFQPIDVVCDPSTIAAQHKMVSITQAFAVDLTGQVCADQFNGDFYGGIAAQGDFLEGASRSPGGKAIICLTSLDDDQTSRIRPMLRAGEGVTIPRSDVHYVITEYGMAYLFGKSIRERAVSLILIAHPASRQALLDQAVELGYLAEGMALRNLQAYAVEEEHHVDLKDKRKVLLRPAGAVDGDEIRHLFHQLSERDVYTRFFRSIRGLSISDAQRLCNLNFETEMGLVAVTGTREHPMIVGHGMYVVDPSTNLAETAFIVHPDWQGVGLGSQLQRHMVTHAMASGVRGFVAEILSTNDKMIKLARSSAASVQVEDNGGSLRVTTLF